MRQIVSHVCLVYRHDPGYFSPNKRRACPPTIFLGFQFKSFEEKNTASHFVVDLYVLKAYFFNRMNYPLVYVFLPFQR